MERLAGIYPDGPIAESPAEQLYRDRDRSETSASTGVKPVSDDGQRSP